MIIKKHEFIVRGAKYCQLFKADTKKWVGLYQLLPVFRVQFDK